MTSSAEESSSLRSVFARRTEALERFAAWQAQQISIAPPGAAFSAATWLYDLLPASSRIRAVQTEGVGQLHRALSRLSAQR